MKRNFAMKAPLALLLICNALFFTSCSSLWLRRGQTVDSVSQGTKAENVAQTAPQTVPKEQYDELARKYQELLSLSRKQAPNTAETAPAPVDPNAQAMPHTPEATTLDPSELVNRIDTAIPDTAKVDTVDALNPEVKNANNSKGPPVPTSMGVQHLNNTDDIDEQITRLREVSELVKVNKFDNALSILKELENSKEKQIVVRAKMMLGDLLFNQGEYDLASQVYDEVVKKYAFSGFVLKALGRLVACSEKLKQPEKQAKYYSLLHDFFEAS